VDYEVSVVGNHSSVKRQLPNSVPIAEGQILPECGGVRLTLVCDIDPKR